ncbi:MAG: hypothetical protein AAF682_05460 [Planctomycetota bacterium]
MTITAPKQTEQTVRSAGDAPQPKGCRPSFGCLVRAPLGCLSFFFGAGIVFVFLLPASFGRMMGPKWESAFAERHLGTLTFGEFRLAWFSRQRIENVLLLAPGEEYVASADVELPALWDLFDGLGDRYLGPLSMDLSAALVTDANGSLNLARAFEERAEADVVPSASSQASLSGEGLRYLFEVGSWHFSWETPAMHAAGRELNLTLEKGRLELANGDRSDFSGSGTARWSFRTEAGQIKGEGPVEVEVTFDELQGFLMGLRTPHTFSWSVDGLDAAMLAVVGPEQVDYVRAFGDRIGRLRLERAAPGDDTVRVELRSEPAALILEGRVRGDAFVPPAAVAGEDPEVSHVGFALEGYWSEVVVARLLPFLDGLQPADPTRIGRLELRDFALPLDGALERASADVTLHVGEASYTLFPHLGAGSPEEPWDGLSTVAPVRVAPLRMRLDGGVIFYPDQTFELREGVLVELGGRYDLIADELDLQVRLPVAEATGLTSLELELPEEGPVELMLSGPAAAPRIRQLLKTEPEVPQRAAPEPPADPPDLPAEPAEAPEAEEPGGGEPPGEGDG